jgi:hypothetical protein
MLLFGYQQRVLGLFPQNSRSWFSRDKNCVSSVIEALHNKQPKGQRLLDHFFNNCQVSG